MEIKKIKHLTINLSHPLSNYLTNGFPIWSNIPSVQFGLESALIMALSPQLKHTISTHHYCHNLSDLASLTKTSIIKCKVGNNPLKQELSTILLHIKSHKQCKFRFDANNKFTLNQAIDFFSSIPKNAIDYIEDPCHKKHINQFHTQTNLPLAFDWLNNTPLPTYILKSLVIKPTLIGSLKNILALIKKKPSTPLIFSSTYETIIGLSAISRLAYILSPKQAHGLNTLYIYNKNKQQQSLFENLTLKESISCIQ